MQPFPAGLGRYRIERELGSGGMGVVYRAFDPMVERPVAIKTIRCPEGSGRQLIERLRREAKAVGSLEHANIVTLFDVGDFDGVFYLVMQLVEGETLRERIDRHGKLSPEEILSTFRQLLAALEYAHARGIVHRDVKPANVMITLDGTVKLTDFGVARITGPAISCTGLVVGTPSYMAPEQMLGDVVDGRSDIFAAGCILYELILGQKPFPANSTTGVIHKVLHDVPAMPDLMSAGVRPGLSAVVLKALARQPADRYGTCAEFLKALEKCLADEPRGIPDARQKEVRQALPIASRAARQLGVLSRHPVAVAVGIVSTLSLLSPALDVGPPRKPPVLELVEKPPILSEAPPAPEPAVIPETAATLPPAATPQSRTTPQPVATPLPAATPQPVATLPPAPVLRRPLQLEERAPAPMAPPPITSVPGISQLAPDNFSACMVKGDLAFQQDRYSEAVVLYRKALLLQPDSSAAKRRLATALALLGQPESPRQAR